MIKPMLSKSVEVLPGGKNYIYEIKLDGQRTIAEVNKGKLLLYTRNFQIVTQKYPELSDLRTLIKRKSVVIDGEIVALENGLPSFELLQQRMSLHDLRTLRTVTQTVPVLYYAFDILEVDGKSLFKIPLFERKQILADAITPSDMIKIVPVFESKEIILRKAREFGYEGVVAKKRDSFYYPGVRNDCWLKHKFQLVDSFVIGGWLEGGRSHGFGSLLIGRFSNKQLVYHGRVGTGFNERSVASLMERFQRITTRECPFSPRPSLPKGVHWLKPSVVADVKFKEWTRARILRAPVFIAVRDDLEPRSIKDYS